MIAVLDAEHGRIGQATLERRFPGIPRRRLQRLHRAWHRLHRRPCARLSWNRPGTVWAMDFTCADAPIEGECRWLLSVRDLASGMRLAVAPFAEATAANALATLAGLIHIYGAPLVLKTDNGSHFTAEAMAELLDRAGIEHLRSPARRPSYNGAIEADIAGFKARLRRVMQGRAGPPTTLDVARACLELNAEVRSRDGRSADERWEARDHIPPEDRAAFRAAVRSAEIVERRRIHDRRTRHPRPLSTTERVTVTRRAIRRVLVARGELIITWSNATSSGKLNGFVAGN